MKFNIVSSFLFITLFLFACGGEKGEGSGSEANETDTSETKGELLEEEEKEIVVRSESRCYESTEGLTDAYFNLKIEGKEVQGVADYITPKAGFELYSYYNIQGSVDSKNEVNLRFTLMESDGGQGLGETYEEKWRLEGENLVYVGNPDEVLVSALKKVECYEGVTFQHEAQTIDRSVTQHRYSGLIGENLKIEMILEAQVNPEDSQDFDLKGNYFYQSQGPDKKIELSGLMSSRGMSPCFIYEVKDGKEYGKFVFEISLREELDQAMQGFWVSADGTKELDVQLEPMR